MAACLSCGADLGRLVHGNRRYCGLECRRRKERERRAWDAHRRSIRFYERNAEMPCRTPLQRATWLGYADVARRTLGQRP